MEEKFDFTSILNRVSFGSGTLYYDKFLKRLINELENENIDKLYFIDAENEATLSFMFKRMERQINSNADLQYRFVKALVDHDYVFNVRYDDICTFINNKTLNGIHYEIEKDPFANTVRILKYLDRNVKVRKDVLGDATGYEYPLKAAAEQINFGFFKNLVNNSYSLERDGTFKSSPLPVMLLTVDREVLSEAFDECKKIKMPFDVVDVNGDTLLHYAIRRDCALHTIKLLVESCHVDPSKKNNDSVSAIELAKDLSSVIYMYLKNI